MNPSDVAPLVVSVVITVVIGGVLLLRPITKRLGVYLEVLAEERRRTLSATPADTQRLVSVLESLDDRVARLEERQEFTDSLLVARPERSLPNRSGEG
jgi:hypothetical protein